MGLVNSSAPAVEPVTLAEAKAHAVVTTSSDDDLIADYIKAARIQAEKFTNRALIQQGWKLYLDEFPEVIYLPKPPLISVDSIEYVDGAGTLQTLASASYQVAASSDPGRIMPAFGENWPTVRRQMEAVVVSFTCGFAALDSSPADPTNGVPQDIKEAILMMVAESYELREAALIGTTFQENPRVTQKLSNYRVRPLA